MNVKSALLSLGTLVAALVSIVPTEVAAASGLRDCSSVALLPGANLSRCDLRNQFISVVDLSGANLSRADLSGADLVDVNLSGANLNGVPMVGATLVHVGLTSANLNQIDL